MHVLLVPNHRFHLGHPCLTPLHSSYLFHTAALCMFQNLSKLPTWQDSSLEKRIQPTWYKWAADPGSEARSALKLMTFLCIVDPGVTFCYCKLIWLSANGPSQLASLYVGFLVGVDSVPLPTGFWLLCEAGKRMCIQRQWTKVQILL